MAHDIYDDHEQGERVRKWLSENSASLVIGVVAAFAVYFGWDQYLNFQANQKIQAAQTYSGFENSINSNQVDAAEAQLGQLETHYSDNLYADLAALRLAAKMVEEGNLDRATGLLSGLRSSQHTGISDIAGLRLARLFIARDQAQQALDVITSVQASDELEAVVAEVRGDALFRLGRMDDAKAAYEAAVAAIGGNPRPALEMKLEHLKAGDAPVAMEQTS